MQIDFQSFFQPTARQKNNKRPLWILLSLVLIVMAGGGSVVYGQTALTLTVNPLVKFEPAQGSAPNPILVAQNLTLVGPADETIDRATVTLSANFVPNEDQLGITGQDTVSNGSTGNIAWAYDGNTGILTLSGTDTLLNYQTALQQVTYVNVSGTPTLADRTVLISLGSSLYYNGTGHYYEYVPAADISWSDAKTAAEAKTYYGVQGYLVTVTSAEENSFIASKLQGNGWMGASDAGHDKQWKWVTGPEADTWFFTQKGYNASGANTCDIGPDASQPLPNHYTNWASSEPNDAGAGPVGCAGGEDYAHFFKDGQWNDYPDQPTDLNNPQFYKADGYVVEYGGMPTDPTLSLSGIVTIELHAPTDASTHAIGVCSQQATNKWNILGGNAESLRAKLTNPVNFGPKGAYGNYEFKFIDVGDNFTLDTLSQQCDIWYSGYETNDSYSDVEKTALKDWVASNGQVVAGCDDSTHDPVCEMLGYGVTTGDDTYGFTADRDVNPIDCNGALASLDELNMSGGAGGYFEGVDEAHVLAVHETGGVADSSKPIVVYTGKYFLTSDINMIQTGTEADPTMSAGDEVITNNDSLAVNAFSALADVSIGVKVCSSVKPVGTLNVYSIASATGTSTNPAQGVNLPNDTTVELILDASGSMEEPLEDSAGNPSTRIAVAKQVLTEVVDTVLPDNIPVALRAYGTKDGCSSELLVEPAPLDRDVLNQTIADIELKGWTPIAASLEAVQADLANVSGPKLVVLITDGEENCHPTPDASDPNAPLAAIVKLREAGFDVRVNIVGFAINNPDLQDRFKQWARAGGGEYFDAADSRQLDQSIKNALSLPYRVTNDQGKEVATGIIDGPQLELPEGSYIVQILTAPVVNIPVTITKDITMGIGVTR